MKSSSFILSAAVCAAPVFASYTWSSGTPGNCRATTISGSGYSTLAEAKTACSAHSLCTAVYKQSSNTPYTLRYCSQAHINNGWCNLSDDAPICNTGQGGTTYFLNRDLVPGWNIISESSSAACHILTGADAGCIADDAAASFAGDGQYGANEHCTFQYVGDATISFAGDANGKGSHFETHTGNWQGNYWDGVSIFCGTSAQNLGGVSAELKGTTQSEVTYDVTGTKIFRFESSKYNHGGGFKICDDKTYAEPTDFPTAAPTEAPTTLYPTAAPTKAPTTPYPTAAPTEAPTKNPTKAPTAACVPGQSGQGEGDCQDCGIGTYSTTYNAPECEPCLAHPTNGAWTHAAGQSDANCPWGCADGHSPTHGGTKCDAEGATLSLKAGSKTALFTMHKNGALKLSGGDDICIEAPSCATSGVTSADSRERRLGDMGAELSTRVSALEARMVALEAR